MMKNDEVKTLISDLDNFIMRGLSTEKIEEMNFDNFMDHIYEGGAYDLKAFDDSEKKLKDQIKESERLLKYGDESQRSKISDAKGKIAKLKEMKSKIEGLKEKALDKDIEKEAGNYEINDIKDIEESDILDLKKKVTDNERNIVDFLNTKRAINKDCKFDEYKAAFLLKRDIEKYNKLVEDLENENSKPDDKKDANKIEELKNKIAATKTTFDKDQMKTILDEKDVKDIIDNLQKNEIKKINDSAIKTKVSDTEKNIDKDRILREIGRNPEVAKEFLNKYNSGRTATAVTRIADINKDDISPVDIANALVIINTKQNKCIAEKKIAEKEINAKQNTISRIDQIQTIDMGTKSDAELWKDYATGDQKNQLISYSSSWSARFNFWRQSESRNVFSAFFRAFNKNNTMNTAKTRQVSSLRANATNLKNKLMNSFRENLKVEAKNSKVRANEVDRDEVIKKVAKDFENEK